MKKNAVILLFSMVIFGCVTMTTTFTRPTTEQLSRENFGICPPNYKERIAADIGKNLIDPMSALYKFGLPEKSVYELYENERYFGHKVAVLVNAKNRFGGYTGDQLRIYMCFIGGSVSEITQIRLTH